MTQGIQSGITSKKVLSLPKYDTNVPSAHFKHGDPLPSSSESLGHQHAVLSKHICLEYEWPEKVSLSDRSDNAISISWAEHHTSQKRQPPFDISLSSMVPLPSESAHSVAVIKHAMNIARPNILFIIPGQPPVIAGDQPLFAIAKQIQWEWPSQYVVRLTCLEDCT